MVFSSKILYIFKSIIYFGLAEGIRESDLFKVDTTLNKPWIGVSTLLIFIVVMLVVGQVFLYHGRYFSYPIRRTIGILIAVGLLGAIITVFMEDVNCLRYALAAYYGIGGLCQIGLLLGTKMVKHFYFVHDVVCGHIIFIPLFILAALQIPNYIQTWLLYHNALSSGVVVSDILRYARKTQEASAGASEVSQDMAEQIQELRKIVQKQEHILQGAGLSAGGGGLEERNISTDAITSLMVPPAPRTSAPAVAAYGGMSRRPGAVPQSFSMSGLDVWGDMAMSVGDISSAPVVVAPTYQSGSNMPTFTVPTGSGGGNIGTGANDEPQGFSFSQPDTMPPR